MSNLFPSTNELTEALLRVLARLGGEAEVKKLDQEVISELKLSETQKNIMRLGNRTEIQYRLAWVRTKAKSRGLIEKTINKSWKLKK
jgi:restriction system protein